MAPSRVPLAQVVLHKDNRRGPGQQWLFRQHGKDFQIVNIHSGLVLDVQDDDIDDGTSIIHQTLNKKGERANHRWLLVSLK